MPVLKSNKRKKFWRRVLFSLVVLVLLFVVVATRPVLHLARTAWHDRNEIVPTPGGKTDDASRLYETEMSFI